MTPFTSVLIVDDEPAIRDLLTRWVESLGLRACTAASAEEAVATLGQHPCDLAIIDLVMPGKNGLWLVDELLRQHPEIAVVLATGNATTMDHRPPVADFLIKPFKRDRFVLALDRGREWRQHAIEEIEWHDQLTQELHRAVTDVQAIVERERAGGVDEAETLIELARTRIPDVQEHSERVVRFGLSIAQELGLKVAELKLLESAARFHDIGKLAIPDAVFRKPSPLTAGEAAVMRRHVDAGSDILLATRTLKEAARAVYASHEWFGGTGYPQRLKGPAIPLESRIIAVADAYDAMTQDRCYRSLMGSSQAAAELLRSTPAQFDPAVVTAFLALLARH
jgi:response regulator RpfG family c-di-GMP phosphodiesterase